MTARDAGPNPGLPEPPGTRAHLRSRIAPSELALRFGFGAVVSAVAGAIGSVAGERAGGLFLAFPAILPATLTLIEQHEGISRAVSETRGAVVGALALVGFAGVVIALVTHLPGIVALLVATIGWFIGANALYFMGVRMARGLNELVYLPDIAVVEVQPVVETARRTQNTIAVADPATGGAFSALLCSIPGASAVVRGGVVGAARGVLDVSRRAGEDGDAAAIEMACGARRTFDASIGIALMADGGETDDVLRGGSIHVAVVGRSGRRVVSLDVDAGPEHVRARAIRTAVHLATMVAGAADEQPCAAPR